MASASGLLASKPDAGKQPANTSARALGVIELRVSRNQRFCESNSMTAKLSESSGSLRSDPGPILKKEFSIAPPLSIKTHPSIASSLRCCIL